MASKLASPKFDLFAMAAEIKLPLIGRLPITQRLIILGTMAILCSVVAGCLFTLTTGSGSYNGVCGGVG